MTDTPDTDSGGEPRGLLDEWIGRAELADQLGVSVDTLARWESRRIGPPCIRIGRSIHYRRRAVSEWLRSLERPCPSAAGPPASGRALRR